MKSYKKPAIIAGYLIGFQIIFGLVLFVLVQSAAALDSFGTPIDDFESDQNVIVDLAAPAVISSTLVAGDMIGGERDFYVNKTSGALFDRLRLNSRSDFEQLVLTSDPGVQGVARITWDGVDGSAVSLNHTGLNGIDLVSGVEGFSYSGFHIRFVEGDLPINMILDVYTDASNWSRYITQTLTVPQGSPPESMFIPFSALAPQLGAGANFTSVGAIELEFQSAQSADIVIDLIEVTGMEFGDLPAAFGLTNLDDDGARHTLGSLYLGPSRDTESDGQEHPVASGDDLAGGLDDEDGVMAIGNWSDGEGEIEVIVTGGDGCFSAWLDWMSADVGDPSATLGGDNDFGQNGDQFGNEASSEYIIKNQAVVSGTQILSFTFSNSFLGDPVLNVASDRPINGRFRLVPRTDGGACDASTAIGVTGGFASGEVEDHHFTFSPSAISLADSRALSNHSYENALMGVALVLILFSGGFVSYHRWFRPRY